MHYQRQVWRQNNEVIRNLISKTDNTMANKEKGQTMIYRTLHGKLKLAQHEWGDNNVLILNRKYD
jgi:hypothetical protein